MEEIEASIHRYLAALDTTDRQEPEATTIKAIRLDEKILADADQDDIYRKAPPFEVEHIDAS